MPYVPTVVSTGFRVLSAVSPPLAVRVGARTFWRVGPRAAVRDVDRDVHQRASRATVHVDGERVVTYAWGSPDRPAVLLVHGWQLRASRLAPLVVALENAGMRVVAFDGVAHGESTGRRMSAVEHIATMHAVQAAEGPFTAVVGHSLGGLSAGLALHEGFAADRFVSLAAPTGFDAVGATFLRFAGIPDTLHERFCAHVERTFPGSGPGVRDRLTLTAHPVPEHVSTLFVQDSGDRMTDPEDAQRLHAAHPGSELVLTNGLGHNRVLDDPGVHDAVVTHVTAPARAR
ncbi:alpha/beta fold hydrolase [Isoptericola sp. NEAU-Y5]|uniref:Alpha/beta fold hydrolase n=1 Tax=Isoptericola luteus TaxID=2879484 RepID=A0ABS7ZG72_9MICO|nr:alpha/beta fold hydrolase [Isoptericola sp. NEAU-Y5]MCA5893923.1 alpha/beta fold hydrolase [Isoptericola sp. NEAU-Y5]